MSEQIIPILYIGLHPETSQIVDYAPCKVVGVARLDEYIYKYTLHPAHLFFQLTYFLHIRNKNSFLTTCAYRIWSLLQPSATGVYARYRDWLAHVICNGIYLVDVANTDVVHAFISTHKVGLIVVNSWSILPKELFTRTPYGGINIHPSRLPQYKGALPTLWSLKNHDQSSAVTMLVLSASVDGGDVVSQHEYPITDDDTALDLEYKIDIILREHLHGDLVNYLKGTTQLQTQVGVESWTERYEPYQCIDWEHEHARDIYNKILLYPYLEPGIFCYTTISNRIIHIRNATLVDSLSPETPGTYVVQKNILTVSALVGSVSCKLFRDISFTDSCFFLWNRCGIFTSECASI